MEAPEADVVNRGRGEIVANISTALTGARTVHHGHMPEIDLTGADTARGLWAMSDLIEWSEGQKRRAGLQGYGNHQRSTCVSALHGASPGPSPGLRVDDVGSSSSEHAWP